MDVFFRTSGNMPYVLFIENKVAELKEDVAPLLSQMERYYTFLDGVSHTNPGYCCKVYPAYFGFETDTAEALSALAAKEKSILHGRLITFPIERMLKAFAGSGYESNPVLHSFHDWLTLRERFIRFRASARKGANVPIKDVIEASKPLGFGHLLQCFVDGLRTCSRVYRHISEESVDIRNINFRMGSRSRATPITVRWYYNSGSNGLYIGIHKNFEKLIGARIYPEALPTSFAKEIGSEWQFGYLKTEDEVRRFWSGIR